MYSCNIAAKYLCRLNPYICMVILSQLVFVYANYQVQREYVARQIGRIGSISRLLLNREGSSLSLSDLSSPSKAAPSEFQHVQLRDLEVIATLGMGGFGRVELVKFFHSTIL